MVRFGNIFEGAEARQGGNEEADGDGIPLAPSTRLDLRSLSAKGFSRSQVLLSTCTGELFFPLVQLEMVAFGES